MMGQIRLAIAGLILVALLSMGILALWYRSEAIGAEAERDRARADLTLAADANRKAVATIADMQAQARRDNQVTAAMVDELKRINEALAVQSAALTDLEKSNADVRAYLDTAVPDDLRRLYAR